MSDVAVSRHDLRAFDQLLSTAFFEPWLIKGLYLPLRAEQGVARRAQKGCDYAISFGDTLVLIDVHQATFDARTNLIQEWTQFRKIALPNSRRRLAQVEHALHHQLLYQDASCQQPLMLHPQHVYKICVTSAYEQLGLNQYAAILHAYGSAFYSEDFVLDEEENPLLVYSLEDFTTIVEQLNSFRDWFAFCEQHHSIIAHHRVDYDGELELLERHIGTHQPFVCAMQQERRWIEQGMKSQYSDLLMLAQEHPNKAFRQAKRQAVLWQRLIERYAQRKIDSTLDSQQQLEALALHDVLADESVVSQALLSQAMQRQAAMAAAQANEGYLVHLRSPDRPDRHYVLMFYAQDPDHRYSREHMLTQLPTLAKQVNCMEQDPPLAQIVVLGIRSMYGRFVSADIAYLTGYEVPVAERVSRNDQGQLVNQGVPMQAAISRQAPCPCGSGVRYKHCCGCL